MLDLIIKRFEQPDEVREHEKGRFELITIGGLTVGRATYEPGWRWREHVGALTGTPLCEVEHVGLVLQGRAMVQMADGRTRAFINDQPVSVQVLRATGATLVEIHGQHDDRALTDAASHRALLDALAAFCSGSSAQLLCDPPNCWAPSYWAVCSSVGEETAGTFAVCGSSITW